MAKRSPSGSFARAISAFELCATLNNSSNTPASSGFGKGIEGKEGSGWLWDGTVMRFVIPFKPITCSIVSQLTPWRGVYAIARDPDNSLTVFATVSQYSIHILSSISSITPGPLAISLGGR